MRFFRSAVSRQATANYPNYLLGDFTMKTHLGGIAVAALLIVASPLAHADDTPAPKDIAAPAAPAQAEAPASVPRPSIVPKTAETSPPAAAEPAPRHHRRYAHRHTRHYAYWEPFPIYWPHFHRHGVYWSRISWFGL